MKKAIRWIQILVIIVQLFVVVLLGFEVYGKMNPDNMIIEAIIIGICLAANIICAFLRYAYDKK